MRKQELWTQETDQPTEVVTLVPEIQVQVFVENSRSSLRMLKSFVVILYFCLFVCSSMFLYAFNGTLEPTWAIFVHGKLFNYVILGRWVGAKLIIPYSAISLMSNSLQPALIDFEC